MENEAKTKRTSVINVSKGDVFIYKITRQNEDGEDAVFYGIIKIHDTINVDGTKQFRI